MIGSMLLSELQSDLNAQLHGRDVEFDSVCTDSRKVVTGDLFVALSGPHFDGHDYVQAACEAGAVAAVVSRPVTLPAGAINCSQLQVMDCLIALGQIARLNRQRFQGKLIALTGSAGKTSTKEMLGGILATVARTRTTQGNLNNEIGVPVTLLSIDAEDAFAVIEMGAAKPGDIAYLCGLSLPDIALVTNVHPAHIEGFGSLQAVAETKGEIYASLGTKGIAIINADQEYETLWQQQAGTAQQLRFSIGGKPADVSAKNIRYGNWSISFELYIKESSTLVTLSVPGRHNLSNAVAAAACAWAAGLSIDNIRDGLESYRGVAGRLQLKQGINGSRVIDDCYNANPGSVMSAIDVLAGLEGSRILVLGEMAELGDESHRLHLDIARYAVDAEIDEVLVLGSFAEDMAENYPERVKAFRDKETLIARCQQLAARDCTLLIKGSRSAKMEEVCNALLA